MARFIQQSDYDMQIKQEIIRLLTDTDFYNSAKLVRAEQTAIDQIKNRIAKRYDCDAIFSGVNRDEWMTTITIDIALYHLYSQTGAKDIPEHRANRYQDAIDWLKDVGNGTTTANLPPTYNEDGEEYGDVIINSRKPENHRW